MRHSLLVVGTILVLSIPGPLPGAGAPKLTYTGNKPRIQNPLSPEDSRKLIVVPRGFEVRLFAAEPNIVNPIALAWDERGRLFVLQSVDYPHDLGKPVGGDKITICEDTNGDGRADRFTVFAEKLSLATGIACTQGGVIVAQAPDMVYLQDTNGDGKSDSRKVLFTGFGTHDTHAGPSNLRYGLDNLFWGSVGYSGFKGTFGGVRTGVNKGVYRFTADGKRFEPVGQFNNNTWGLGLSETFDIFGSTANNNHCIYVGIPKRYHRYVNDRRPLNVANIQGHYKITAVSDKPLQQVDVRGGYTAAAGACVYTARAFPKEYWNRVAFVNEPTGHLVHIAKLVPDGAGYKEEDGGNILASRDEWTAPVYSEVGPDGQLWVADWYNLVIQHNADRRGMPNQIWNAKRGRGNAHLNPLRDKSHGRIYRVVYRSAPRARITRLDAGNTAALVRALADPNMFWRTTAQRLLVQGGKKDAVPALLRLVGNTALDANGLNAGALHALWTLKGPGRLAGMDPQANQAAYRALAHPSAGVRKAAVQVLPDTIGAAEAVAASGVLSDKNLHTRLAAVLRVSELPHTAKLLAALEKSAAAPGSDDKWIRYALRIATGQTATAGKEAGLDAYQVVAPSALEKAVTWKYTTRRPPRDWMKTAFDTKSWREGKGGFGTRGTPNVRVRTVWNGRDIWLRRVIDLPDGGAGLRLKLHHDEDYEVFINGVLAARAGGYTSNYEVVNLLPAGRKAIRRGRNLFAVHCRQTSGGQYVDFGLVRSRTTAPRAVAGEVQIRIAAVPSLMAYDRKTFTVAPNTKVTLIFTNPDNMPHNIVILRTGTLASFGVAVDAFMKNPAAAAKNYVPPSGAVIVASAMIDPGGTQTITFTTPATPGDYPYVCTFPGHWRMMQGIMSVVAGAKTAAAARDGMMVLESKKKGAIKTLMTGGGGSHDFKRWFGGEDGRTLNAEGLASTAYTEDIARVARELPKYDVLYLSNNKGIPAASRDAIFKHAAAGKGMLIIHPSAWYNWRDWPKYNRELVGGGSRSHERLREFDVHIKVKDHPVTKGVPAKFRIFDELYRWQADPKGTPVQVLAVGKSLHGGAEFPVVWIVKHAKARIVGNTLGHDGRAHQLQAYKTLLRNSLKWAAGK